MPEVGIDFVGSISYYRCRGIMEAKIYVPASFKNLKQRTVRLIYKDAEFTVSTSPMGRGRNAVSGFKVYLPRRIVKELLDTRPNRVLLEVDGGNIRMLGFGWECKVCGRFTQELDKLCWNHRIGGGGQCKRCGRMILQPIQTNVWEIQADRTLCDECLNLFASKCNTGGEGKG
jgi:hypothetical protein